MTIQSFIFGGNTNNSYKDIQQQRKALEARGIVPYNPQTLGEGLSDLGAALGNSFSAYKLNKEEKARQNRANNVFSAFQTLLGGHYQNPNKITSPMGHSPSNDLGPVNQQNNVSSVNAPMDLSDDKKAFINALMPSAIEESKRTGVDPRVIVGQAALETGWGKSAPGNNFFGIKAHGNGDAQTLMTHEVTNNGPVEVQDSFRQYASPIDSVHGYGDFLLQNPRYADLRNAKGLNNQLAALQASGYATDPSYGAKVGKIAQSIHLPEMQDSTQQNGGLNANDQMAFAPQSEDLTAPSQAIQQQFQPRPQQQAAGMGSQTQPQSVDPRLFQMISDPSLSPQQQSAMQTLLLQRLKENSPVDPLKQTELEKAQIELHNMENPGRKIIKGADGFNYYQDTGERVLPNIKIAPAPGYHILTPEEAKATGLPPGAYQVGPKGQVSQVGGAGTNVTVNAQNESQLNKERDKGLASHLNSIANDGVKANNDLVTINRLGDLLNGVDTGNIAALKESIGSVTGIPIPGGADLSRLQAIRSLIDYMAPRMRVAGTGASSDKDIEIFKSSLPSLMKTPEGNQEIMNTLRGMTKYRAESGKIASDWQLGQISAADAIKKMRELPSPFEPIAKKDNGVVSYKEYFK